MTKLDAVKMSLCLSLCTPMCSISSSAEKPGQVVEKEIDLLGNFKATGEGDQFVETAGGGVAGEAGGKEKEDGGGNMPAKDGSAVKELVSRIWQAAQYKSSVICKQSLFTKSGFNPQWVEELDFVALAKSGSPTHF